MEVRRVAVCSVEVQLQHAVAAVLGV